jgi:hypothetical protein
MNPCLSCGACCAFYRASFYWAEADDATPGGVPADLTEPLFGLRRVMKGTATQPARCIALEGEIGVSVRCAIHANRASVCRAFRPSFEGKRRNPRCDKARAAHGLPPLTPASWVEDDLPPRSDPPVPRAA